MESNRKEKKKETIQKTSCLYKIKKKKGLKIKSVA